MTRTANMKKNDDKTFWAFLSVFLLPAGFLLALFARKKDAYVMYYAKHSLVLFLFFVIVWVAGMLPLIGWAIRVVGIMLFLILWVLAFVAALSGEKKTLPVVTELAEKIEL